MTTTTLDAALAYAARGWYVFPCWERPGDPYQDKQGRTVTPGEKSPHTTHGNNDATTDPATIRAWWGRWPGAAIAADNARSLGGIVTVDQDVKGGDDGPGNWAALGITEAGALLSQTPSGGRHTIYAANGADIRNSAGKLGPGIDVRGKGGYTILPPSQTTDGQYIALNDWTATPADIPGALAVLLTKSEAPRPREYRPATTPQDARPGDDYNERGDVLPLLEGAGWQVVKTRGDVVDLRRPGKSDGISATWNHYPRKFYVFTSNGAPFEAEHCYNAFSVYSLLEHRGDFSAAARELARLGYGSPSPPAVGRATSETATATATGSAPADAIAGDLLKAPVDHEGHAQVVLRMHAGRIAYNAAFGWLWYTGTHWERDAAEAHITRATVETLKARAIAGIKAEADMDKFVKKCSCDAGRITGIMAMLEALTYTPAAWFDAAPHLLNVKNGVLNLRDLTLTPHEAGQKFTYCLGADYDPTAHEGAAYRDLLTIIDDWTPDAAYLQVAGGYSLTGDTSEEVLFYMLGPARAGKGSLTEALLTLLPYPLATEAGFETFANDRGGDSQNFDLAPLRPCRAVFSSESERRHQLNAARVKRLTGGNWITCAYKYRDQFTYRPAFKIWLSSNFPPSLDPDDDAAWGRVKVLKFPNSHLGAEDLSIKKRLKSRDYQAALLHWLADGAAIWHTTGLPRANEEGDGARIAKQTQAERDDQDFVLQFTEERLTATGNEADRLTTAETHTAYESWCRSNGVPPRYINQFVQALKAKGWDYRKMPGGARCFVGVKLC